MRPTARHGLGAAAVGGKIYVIGGGVKPGASKSGLNEVFDPGHDAARHTQGEC
jgi:hypothetical protein